MTLLERYHEGGFFMHIIMLFMISTIILIVERAIALYIKFKKHPEDFREKILAFIKSGDLVGAERYSKEKGGDTILGRIAALGVQLKNSAAGEEELQGRMDETLSQEVSRLDRRTGFLAMCGNVATLVGLLGTIVGMISSFASVAAANPADRATLLSAGISEAMNCTAFGLLTAIPALVAFAIFQNRTDRIVTEITETTTSIYHDLVFLSESGEQAFATPSASQGENLVTSPSPKRPLAPTANA